MLDLWHHRAGLKTHAREIAKKLENPGAKVIVRAAIGAGRHSIVKQLSALVDVAIIELPPFEDMDTPLHGLIQLAIQAGTLDAALDRTHDLNEKARLAGEALTDKDRPVVVLFPVPRAGRPREGDAVTRHFVEEMLATLGSSSHLRIVVLATRETRLRSAITDHVFTIDLETPVIGADSIDTSKLPDEFRAAATGLASWMSANNWSSTPLEARLQVGLIALGERPAGVAFRLEALARKMTQQLARWPAVAAAVRKLLLVRRALSVSDVETVSGVEPRWLPLLTTCIGYGDETIRVPEVTRQVLLDALSVSSPELEVAHGALASYHESLDGARSLRGLSSAEAIHWLEKVHHLAQSGESGAAKWAEQEPAGREQLWARARHLSRERHLFCEAAAIYEQCIQEFGRDPYSSHYLAYNLDRAHSSSAQIRRGYEFAATEEPDNPWWQQRWIRHLITHGTLAEARAAWQRAIRAIDPEGTRLRQSSWLALNLHYWVARRWLALGHLADARAVLSEVPQRWLDEEAELRALLQILTVEEQSLVLGESVYPASVAVEDRWKRPRSLRRTRAGQQLLWWAPGRVVHAAPSEVAVVVAPTPDDAQQLVFDAATWRELAGEPAEDAEGFFELGQYEGGERIVRSVPDDGEGHLLDPEDADLFERVSTWQP